MEVLSMMCIAGYYKAKHSRLSKLNSLLLSYSQLTGSQACTFTWCLTQRCRCGIVSPVWWWLWKTNHLCIKVPLPLKKYQIDKEELVVIFGITKFQQYLLGQHFLIYSNHKLLMHFFGKTHGVPGIVSARTVLVSAYSYSIFYRPGKDFSNTDGLRQLPLPDVLVQMPLPTYTALLLECLQASHELCSD